MNNNRKWAVSFFWLFIFIQSLSSEPVGTLTSNSIHGLYPGNDTLWILTWEGANFTADGGTTFVGYKKKEYFEGYIPWTLISKYGRTFVSLADTSYSGGGIAEFRLDNWSIEPFSWKDGNHVFKYGVDVVAFDSVFYFTYLGGGCLKKDIRAGGSGSWEIIIPDTTGNMPKDFSFSSYPPDTIKNSYQGTTSVALEYITTFIALDSLTPDSANIYIGTRNGIFVSGDECSTWSSVPLPDDSTGLYVYGLWNQNKSSGSVLWASFLDNECADTTHCRPVQKPGLFYTDDGGITWTNNNLDYFTGDPPLDIAFTGDVAWIVNSEGLYKFNGQILVRPDDFRSNGLLPFRCSSVSARIVNGDTCLWIATEDGLYYSSDAGKSGSWENFKLKLNVAAGLQEVYAVPGILTNTGPQYARFAYSLSQDAKTTITIYDWNMRKVKTVIQDEMRRAGASSANSRSEDDGKDRWNGTNDRGAKVSVGTYYFKIQTDKGEKGFGKIMVVR